jgi:hypothetical protein
MSERTFGVMLGGTGQDRSSGYPSATGADAGQDTSGGVPWVCSRLPKAIRKPVLPRKGSLASAERSIAKLQDQLGDALDLIARIEAATGMRAEQWLAAGVDEEERA